MVFCAAKGTIPPFLIPLTVGSTSSRTGVELRPSQSARKGTFPGQHQLSYSADVPGNCSWAVLVVSVWLFCWFWFGVVWLGFLFFLVFPRHVCHDATIQCTPLAIAAKCLPLALVVVWFCGFGLGLAGLCVGGLCAWWRAAPCLRALPA